MSETDNVDALIGLLQSDFTVYREVEVRHALFRRRSLRVDVLAVPVDPALSDIAVAFEVKGYAVWDSDTLARCLKQAGDYVLSSVEARSKDASTHNGKRVMATFVYPPLHPYSDKMSGKEAYLLGMAQMAGASQVGWMKPQSNSSGPYLQLMCPAVVWNSQRGWAKNARDILVGKRQIGSQRFDVMSELAALENINRGGPAGV